MSRNIPADLTPCHTGAAARTCAAFDAALAELEVDTGEFRAVTSPLDIRALMLQAALYACTCISCGAPWGQPHNPGCPQTSFRDGADSGPVDARATGGITVLTGAHRG